MKKLIKLFLEKSGKKDPNMRKAKKVWRDAYTIPVILLGKKAIEYAKNLQGFTQATKVSLEEEGNEISFVIHKKLSRLRALPAYKCLKDLDFKEETCLGNDPFIEYIDKIGKI